MAQVSVCPKTSEEIKVASNKLGCGNDRYENNQYLCIPNDDTTSLVHFCDDGEMGLVEEGNCLVASVGRVILRKCLDFLSGCPNTTYDKNTVYKYTACQEINTVAKCYIAEPSCPPQTTNDLSNINANVVIALAVIAFVLVCYWWREIVTAFYRCSMRLRNCYKPGNDINATKPEYVSLTSDQDDQGRVSSQFQPNTDPLNSLERITDENSGNGINGAELAIVCLTSDQDDRGRVSSPFQPNTNLSNGLQETNEHSSSQVHSEDEQMEHSSPNSEKNSCRGGDCKVTVNEDAQIGILCFPRNKNLDLTMGGNASILAVCEATDLDCLGDGSNLSKDLGIKAVTDILRKDFGQRQVAQIPTKDFGQRQEAQNPTKDLENKNGEPSVTKDLGIKNEGPSITKDFGDKREVHIPTKDIGNTRRKPDPNYFGNDEAEIGQQQAMATIPTSSGLEILNDTKTAAVKPMERIQYDTICQQ